MQIGSVVQFRYDNEIHTGKIYDINGNLYDIIGLNERNVPIEMLSHINMKEGSIINYRKQFKTYEVYVIKVDKYSQSAQVKMFYRNINLTPVSESYCLLL